MTNQGIRFVTIDYLLENHGEDTPDTPVIGLTPGEAKALSELGSLTGGVDVWRDWEGCLTAWLPRKETRESAAIECVISISSLGDVAHYDVNQPRYHTNVSMLIADLRMRTYG